MVLKNNSVDELKILNIYERIFLRKAKFMFNISKSVNQMFPFRHFNETLQSLRSTGALDVNTPRPQKEIFKQGLIYSGSVIWNNLPVFCLIWFFTSTQQSFSYAGRSSWVEPVLS